MIEQKRDQQAANRTGKGEHSQADGEETEQKRGQQAANRTSKGQHSHPNEQRQSKRKVSRQQTGQARDSTYILVNKDRAKERSVGREQKKQRLHSQANKQRQQERGQQTRNKKKQKLHSQADEQRQSKEEISKQ